MSYTQIDKTNNMSAIMKNSMVIDLKTAARNLLVTHQTLEHYKYNNPEDIAVIVEHITDVEHELNELYNVVANIRLNNLV